MSRTIRYNLLFLGIAVTAGIVYGFTLAPSVVHIDSGELAAVQSTLGIAHPTGYPLFTILGYLFLRIPLFPSKIAEFSIPDLLCCRLIFLGKISSIDSHTLFTDTEGCRKKEAAAFQGKSIASFF